MSINYKELKADLGRSGIQFQAKGNTSFSFQRSKDEVIAEITDQIEKYNRTLKCIKRHFQLDDDFDSYFCQATSGSGNEAEKIDSIWSSSLLSLLFFYTAMKSGGITFSEIHYTKCFFEFMNPVLQNRPYYNKPSNIDCVLLSEDEKNLLFIESKFIEYVRDVSKKCELKDKYAREGESTEKLYKWFQKKQESHKNNEDYFYNYGAKQMITHFSGLYNFCNKCYHPKMNIKDSEKNNVINAHEKGAKVSFIEIIYDMSLINAEYTKYRDDYIKLQKELYKQIKNAPFDIYEPITYQKFLADTNAKISDTVKEYYSF